MGNAPKSGESAPAKAKSKGGLQPVKSYKKANKLLDKQAQESLRQDWAKVKGVPEANIDFNNTSVNLQEFKALMNPEMRVKDVEALFNLYDCDHNGSITWKEYIVVITLIMGGSTKEKIKLIFNCFDSDQSGTLDKEEFITAALRFSPNSDNVEATKTYAAKIFAAVDKNGDGSVSYKEFSGWVSENPLEFEKFAGVLNILQDQDD